jgi:SP family arabinose:H+ symporter-like MFS transporter
MDSKLTEPAVLSYKAASSGSPLYLAGVCFVASLGGLLFGFDTAVISGTVDFVTRQFQLDKLMEGWFLSSALIGCIAGALIVGALGDRLGRKPALLIAAVLFFVSAWFSTFPPDFKTLIVARVIGGLGVGMASVLAPMFISEFSPPRVRGRVVALYQLSIVIGILAAYFSNWMLLGFAAGRPDAFAGQGWLHKTLVAEVWRGMFGAEMFPAGLFFILLLFVPESPRWLIKEGRTARAFNILAKVGGADTARREMLEIQEAVTREAGTLAELFRPGLRLALLVGVGLSVFGQLTGVNVVVYYGPKILRQAGFPIDGALQYQVALGVVNLIFTVLAIWKIDSWGRRPLLVGGMAVVTVATAVTGLLFLLSATGGIWIVLVLCIYMGCVSFSICAVIWVLTPEIFPNRVRGRAASIATFANWSTNFVSMLLFPTYVDRYGMHTAFFTFTAICLVATLFFWKFVPETRGKSLEQIEKHWLNLANAGRAKVRR